MRADRLGACGRMRVQFPIFQRRVQNRDITRSADLGDALRICLFDIGSDLIIYLQKGFGIIRVDSEFEDPDDIQHRPVRKKGHIHLPHPVRRPVPLQKIHQRQGTFVVTIQHRGPLRFR